MVTSHISCTPFGCASPMTVTYAGVGKPSKSDVEYLSFKKSVAVNLNTVPFTDASFAKGHGGIFLFGSRHNTVVLVHLLLK